MMKQVEAALKKSEQANRCIRLRRGAGKAQTVSQ